MTDLDIYLAGLRGNLDEAKTCKNADQKKLNPLVRSMADYFDASDAKGKAAAKKKYIAKANRLAKAMGGEILSKSDGASIEAQGRKMSKDRKNGIMEASDGPPEEISAVARAYKQALVRDNDRTKVTVYHGPDGWTASTMYPSYPCFFVSGGKLYARPRKKPPGRKRQLRGPIAQAVSDYLDDNL